jgi:putative NADH-flavin reductase
MRNILILGATGKLGQVLVKNCLDKNYAVTALVRNPQKMRIIHKNLKIIPGDITNSNYLTKALSNVEIVISVLGHGFRTSFPIQEKTMTKLFPLMEKNKIERFITVTGAGLKIKGDPHSLIADLSEKIFYVIDPYRMRDAKNQQELIEKSNLDWTVVRTPIHNDGEKKTVSHIGFNQPPIWKTISRTSISNFMINCIENTKWIKKSPIIY